jgi:hypothetical protein
MIKACIKTFNLLLLKANTSLKYFSKKGIILLDLFHSFFDEKFSAAALIVFSRGKKFILNFTVADDRFRVL